LIYNFFPEEKTSIFRIFRKKPEKYNFREKTLKIKIDDYTAFLVERDKKAKNDKNTKITMKNDNHTRFLIFGYRFDKNDKMMGIFSVFSLFLFFSWLFFFFPPVAEKRKKYRENNKKMWR